MLLRYSHVPKFIIPFKEKHERRSYFTFKTISHYRNFQRSCRATILIPTATDNQYSEIACTFSKTKKKTVRVLRVNET